MMIMYSQAITSVLLFIFWGFVFGAEPYFYNPPPGKRITHEDIQKMVATRQKHFAYLRRLQYNISTTESDDYNTTMTTIPVRNTGYGRRPTHRRIKYSTRPPFYLPGLINIDASRGRHLFIRPRVTTIPPTTLPPLLNVEKCPDRDGWALKSDFCYFFSSEETSYVEKKSWRDARRYCVQQGGDLLSIEDSDESLFISQYIRKFADILLWIGGREEFIGSFKWSDGKPFLFNNWNLNEPNSVLGQEDCLSLYPANGKWNDDNCGRSLSFICKKPKDGNYTSNAVVKPIGHTSETKGNCPEGSSKAGGKCFVLYKFPKSYEDAMMNCRSTGGELASINSQFEQDVISSMFYDVKIDIDYVWIGMKYMNGFLWLDQSTVDYTNWNKGEPNNNRNNRPTPIWKEGPIIESAFNRNFKSDQEECVEIIVKESYLWNDKSCKREKSENRFICQTPVDSNLDFDPNIKFCDYPDNDFVKKGDGCYKVIDELKSWKEAEEFCQQLGSNLMSIEFLEENNYIYTSLLSNYTSDDRFWMGMKYNNKTQSFKFSDENPVLFTNWGMDANDSCVVLSVSDNGKWYSEPCSKEHKFICKYSSVKYILEGPDVTGSCPSEQWIDFHGEYCYLFETEEKVDWMNANIRCQREGSNLASIHSKQEENLLTNFFKRNHIQYSTWIGLVRSGHSFLWSDGTPMDHQNWARGEPNDEEERCGEMAHLSQKWNDNDCAKLMSYLCKTPKIILTDSIPTTEDHLTTAITNDENSSENMFSSMNFPKLSVKSEYQFRNPIMTIIVCLSSISLLVVVSVMAYYYKRKYRMVQTTLRSGAIDDSVHYHGGHDEDQMIIS